MKTELRPKLGTAILFGVNRLNANHYGNSCFELSSAAQDVTDFELIAKLNGLKVQAFLDENSTRHNLLNALKKTSKSLKAGDFFFLTFSGFGGIVTNFGSPGNGPISPTWCLYDGQVLLSEVQQALSDFETGVNILVIADTSSQLSGLKFQSFQDMQNSDRRRALPLEIAETVYLQNKDQYDAIYLGTKVNPQITANVIWVSACQVNQVAFETNYNGYLTTATKHIWNGAAFKGDYNSFFNEIALSMPAYQSPLITIFGENSTEFFTKSPFAI